MKTTLNASNYLGKVSFEATFCTICPHQCDAAASGTPQDVALLTNFCMQNAPHWGLTGHTP